MNFRLHPEVRPDATEIQLEEQYRDAVACAKRCDAFWDKNPIAYTLSPGQTIPQISERTLLDAFSYGTPNSASLGATVALTQWRTYRAEHGHP